MARPKKSTDAKDIPKLIVPKLERRPTVMTPIILEKLDTAFSMGCTDSEACLYAGIHPGTLYNFQKAHPEYLKRKEVLKNNPVLRSKVTVTGDLDRVATAQWYLEHRSPEFRKEGDDGGTKQQFNFFVSDTELVRQLRDYVTGIIPGSVGSDSEEVTGQGERGTGPEVSGEGGGQG